MTELYEVGECTIVQGDSLETLRAMPDGCIQTCVTSPPYYGLRDYGMPGQIGLEQTPDAYVAVLVELFCEVRRVLRDDGTLWLNLGDSYAGSGRGGHVGGSSTLEGSTESEQECRKARGSQLAAGLHAAAAAAGAIGRAWVPPPKGLKQKDLIGIPWRVAFALQADGWYLRQDSIWSKPNPMPESVRDRCTKSHEYIFMLTKSPRYYYDAVAIRNPPSEALLKQVADGYNGKDSKDYGEGGAQSASSTKSRVIEGARKKLDKQRGHDRPHEGFNGRWDTMTKDEQQSLGSNKRSVWVVSPKPFKGAHFATFPPDLIEPCILASTSEHGCCPHCGAAWIRQTETTKSFQSGSGRSGNAIEGKQDLAGSATNSTPDIRMGPVVSTTTLGWMPACGCPEHDTVGCMVMDPFGGAGTTGLVSARHKRKSILLELNPEYVALSVNRLTLDKAKEAA